MYLSAALVALVPPAVVTVTSTVPAVPAGAVAAMVVAVSVLMVADVVPNLTAVALVRLVPVIVTLVPAASGPEDGLTPVTVGAGGAIVAESVTVEVPRFVPTEVIVTVTWYGPAVA